MSSTVPKLCLKNINGFPSLDQLERVKTHEFLTAAKEIVSIIEKFGKLFSPVVYDMSGNIQKLEKFYKLDTVGNAFLEDMIVKDLSNPKNETKVSLLWLKRALEMLEAFFTNVLKDFQKDCSDDLRNCLNEAYKETLQPFHGWIVQQTFSVIYRWTPTRSELFGVDVLHDENMGYLQTLVVDMRSHLDQINKFFTFHNLHCNKKV